jgi:hypothetical protein
MRLVAAITVVSALALVRADASACGNSVYLETDEAAQLVAKAEKAFHRGKYRQVRELVFDGEFRVQDRNLARKLHELVAVSQIRTGIVTGGVSTLRSLLASDPENTYLKTRVAEGLSKLSKKRREALEMLSDLESRDLVADAEGYRALAELRALEGDSAGKDRAIARCKQMAKDEAICTPAEPKTKTAPKKEKEQPTGEVRS